MIDKYTDYAVNGLHRLYPNFSAKELYNNSLVIFLYSMVIITIIGCIFDINLIVNIILFVGNILLLISIIFKITLTIIGIFIHKKHSLIRFKDSRLPSYSLLVPLYKEDLILKNLIISLSVLDYEIDKLQILLLIEEDDSITKTALQNIKLPLNFKKIEIPFSNPRTKAKACNYGLMHATGKYVGIFDAEDSPDKLQLKKVVHRFNQLDDEYICVQAKLNYYNRNENLLSKMFSIEYAHWFEFMLPALYYLKMIIPLGGTSNHFNREKLIEIGGWDPYNVTEDAELGVRLNILGYKTSLIESTTLEESPLDLKTWIPQRTRWIKGYLQTYIVSLKNLKIYWSKLTFVQILGFHLFIGLPAVTYFIIPIMILVFILGVSDIFIDLNLISSTVIWLWKTVFVLGMSMSFLIALLVVVYKRWYKSIIAIMLFPYYLLLHSLATYRALYQLFKKNYTWEKTTHGLSKYRMYK